MTRRYNQYRLYRRLRGEYGEPVYRPVRAETQPDQCELDHGDVVEVHQEDTVGSLPVARVYRSFDTVVAEAAPFTEEPKIWSCGPGRERLPIAVDYPWGFVRVMADRVLIKVGPGVEA